MTRLRITALVLLLATSAEARFGNKWVGKSEATGGPPLFTTAVPPLFSKVVLKFHAFHRGGTGPARWLVQGVVRCRPRQGFCVTRRGELTGFLTQVFFTYALTLDAYASFRDGTQCNLTGRLDSEDPVFIGRYTCPTGAGSLTLDMVRNLGLPRRQP